MISTTDFDVQSKSQTVAVRMITPQDGHLSENPLLLLTFAGDRPSSLSTSPYCLSSDYFLQNGHRVASFDLPNHGDRVNSYGASLDGFRNAFVAGDDPFAQCVADGIAVIDRLVVDHWATPGRIAVCGTSRGGYMALRLLAADRRIAAAAALAPVTDWRTLIEFAGVRERSDVAGLRLTNFADSMATKPIYLAVGTHDNRVSTPSNCEFYLSLVEANARRGCDDSLVEFLIRSVVGHTCDDSWHMEAGAFLVNNIQ